MQIAGSCLLKQETGKDSEPDRPFLAAQVDIPSTSLFNWHELTSNHLAAKAVLKYLKIKIHALHAFYRSLNAGYPAKNAISRSGSGWH